MSLSLSGWFTFTRTRPSKSATFKASFTCIPLDSSKLLLPSASSSADSLLIWSGLSSPELSSITSSSLKRKKGKHRVRGSLFSHTVWRQTCTALYISPVFKAKDSSELPTSSSSVLLSRQMTSDGVWTGPSAGDVSAETDTQRFWEI